VDAAERGVDDVVTDLVESAHRARLHVRGPVADDVVCVAGDERVEEAWRLLGRVRPVAVEQDDVLLLDVLNALADGLAFAGT